MATTSSDELAVAERRLKVSRLHFQGHNQTDIALELDVSQSTVQRDLQWLMDSWRESAVRDLELMFETELMRLRQLQSEAWQAWERSQWRDGPDGKVQVPGDPRFLNIVFRCLQQAAKLMQMMAGKAKTAKLPQQPLMPVSGDRFSFDDSFNETPFADDSRGVSLDSSCGRGGETATGQVVQEAVTQQAMEQAMERGVSEDQAPTGDSTLNTVSGTLHGSSTYGAFACPEVPGAFFNTQAPASGRVSESLKEAASDENQDQKSDDRNQCGSMNASIPSTTAEDVLPDYVLASLQLRQQLAKNRNQSVAHPANFKSTQGTGKR